MKDFFKMMFASVFGVIIAGILLFIVSLFVFMGIVASMSSAPAYIPVDKTVVQIDLKGAIGERSVSNPFAFLMGKDSKSTGLKDILDAIDKAKNDDRIKGIYVKASGANAGFATLEAVRNALSDFKESGKFIVSYGDYYAQGDYYVCSLANKVIMNPQGLLEFLGLSSQLQFYKGMLEKAGIEMQIFKVGTYKSAVEPYLLDKMSAANREQITSYMGDIWKHQLEAISKSRNISLDDLNKYANEGFIFNKSEVTVKYGFVDELLYPDQVKKLLKELVEIGEKDELALATVQDLNTIPKTEKKNIKEKIAVLYAEGEIVPDEVESAPWMSSVNIITAKEFVKELNKLQKDENVKAVVFRVNSRGGSSFASEQIWHAVKELKAVKPIVVSMGDYAASGGYYISCAASKIVAEPTTITGSIGIFGMFPSAEQLSKRMGATFDVVKTNEFADFGGRSLTIPLLGIPLLPARPLNTGEKALIQNYIENGYDLFVSRCADGRSKTKEEIDSIGQGRVWTGNQALALGLVDKVGNINDAIKIAAEAAGIEKYDLRNYPAQKSFYEQILEDSFGGMRSYMVKQFMGLDGYNNMILKNNLKNHDIRQAILLD
ncbi:MAG: signal peptide peptidase SppA [Dysgonamonadaceae bacterium]|jgi:protease-4|nr:signal peptide peptidase SppA [Dysgonamonadaceae bacterium]